jgi:hypothetical protein
MIPIRFHNPSVSLNGSTLLIRASILNESSEAWRPEDGWAAGYHLFEDPTSTLVVDGERTPLDLEPGASRTLEMTIATPPEPGEYSVYISVMRENVAWFYEQGWPFLLVDLAVGEDGAPVLRRSRVLTMRSVRISRLGRSLVRAAATLARSAAHSGRF